MLPENLQKIINNFSHYPYPFQSRIHLLNALKNAYVKRDDELGFGISGSKIRKYRTLIPFLIQSNYKEVIVIGGAYSNHVLSIVQLLIENQMTPILFLRGHPSDTKQGNALLTTIFVDANKIHWISKDDWKHVNQIAEDYALLQKIPVFILPEGGSCKEALPGALTLSLDIVRNEMESNLEFDHLFIDSGTGMMSISLILGHAFLQKKTVINVVLMAEDENAYLEQLNKYWKIFNGWLGNQSIPFPDNFVLHLATLKFGKIDNELITYIKTTMQREGFLIDPIYSGKLFFETQKILDQNNLKGQILIHHSGGSLALMGFQNRLI